ncbi:MAG: phosphoheptose isomerase [Bacteroidetes bacterium]|nr:MAG: phosphoheptose isomerase [Bacteroidota bacterium]PTM11856.1 MAG: phosphoheptose isomerase [Bacteroidota bacterium]
MQDQIRKVIESSIAVKQLVLEDAAMLALIEEVVRCCIDVYERDGKILFCGNGGSAADAQHLAAELSGRFYYDRPPLYAEALHVNTSYLTAVANDYGYDESYARMVRAAGRPGDLLFALSTSGNSPNVLRAAAAARAAGMTVIGFTGQAGGQLATQCDHFLAVPSTDTPRIQEVHLLVGHLICELVEERLFPKTK